MTLSSNITDSSGLPVAPTFSAPREAIVSNSLFFASLCCSLFSAFGAVLAKQWLSEYERTGENRSLYYRGRQRQSRLLAMHKYHCEQVIQALGSVLQISLFLFFAALAYWLWNINKAVAIVVITGACSTLALYLVTTLISIFDPFSPFSTRVSSSLRSVLLMRSRNANLASSRECLAWMQANATSFDTVKIMSVAWARLGWDFSSPAESLEHRRVSWDLLSAIVSNDGITAGAVDGTLNSTLRTLQIVNPWISIDPYGGYRDLPGQVIVSLLQVLQRTAVLKPRDLVQSEMIVGALFKPDLRSAPYNYPKIDRELLVELIESPVTSDIARAKSFAHLWSNHYDLCRRIRTPEGNRHWLQRTADCLLEAQGTPNRWLWSDDYSCDNTKFFLHIANCLGLITVTAKERDWAARFATFSTRVSRDHLSRVFLSEVELDDQNTIQHRCRWLLFWWLQWQSSDSLEWCTLDDVGNMVRGVMHAASWDGSYVVTFIIGPLLWWHHLSNSASQTPGRPLPPPHMDFFVRAVIVLTEELRAHDTTTDKRSAWVYDAVAEALTACGSAVDPLQTSRGRPPASATEPHWSLPLLHPYLDHPPPVHPGTERVSQSVEKALGTLMGNPYISKELGERYTRFLQLSQERRCEFASTLQANSSGSNSRNGESGNDP